MTELPRDFPIFSIHKMVGTQLKLIFVPKREFTYRRKFDNKSLESMRLEFTLDNRLIILLPFFIPEAVPQSLKSR